MFEIHKITIKSNHGLPSYELLDDHCHYLFDTEKEAKSYLDDYLKKGAYTGEIGLLIPILDENNYKIGSEIKLFSKDEAYEIVKRKVYNQMIDVDYPPFHD